MSTFSGFGFAPGLSAPGTSVRNSSGPLGHPLHRIQRSAGNSAVSGLIQRKLRIGAPDSPEEREADRMAAEVMRMPDGAGPVAIGSYAPVLHRKCAACSEEEEQIHRSATGEGPGTAPPIVNEVLSQPGQPLSKSTRDFFEPRLGADLSNVRIHTDSQAARSADAINAKAYTVGSHIAFGADEIPSGFLLAHELAHITRQERHFTILVPKGDSHSSSHSSIPQPRYKSDEIRVKSDLLEPILKRKEDPNTALADVQGLAMPELLTRLQALPVEIRTNEGAAAVVGGPRLVTAMRAVQSRGISWSDFVSSHNSELSSLPVDQINNIAFFLGAPTDARYFKSDELPGRFKGRFDGAVDPAARIVTLFFRVRFEVVGARFGYAQPGTAEWYTETEKGLSKYKSDYKKVVEETWSNKGFVRNPLSKEGRRDLQTKVVVTVVESNEHNLIHIMSDLDGGRSRNDREGTQQVSDNKSITGTIIAGDNQGKHPEQVTYTRNTSAHEFGHAIGLMHVRCPRDDDDCYGVTTEEVQDVMGWGNKVQVIRRGGKVRHDDLEPFQCIADRWAKDIIVQQPTPHK